MEDETTGANLPLNEFDVSFRLIEREIIGFSLKSSSSHRWVALSIMVMFAVSILAVSFWPYIEILMG